MTSIRFHHESRHPFVATGDNREGQYQGLCSPISKERHQDPRHHDDTPRVSPRPSLVKPEKYNNYKHQGGNVLASFLCNILEKHGEQSGKILRRAGLAGAEWDEPASVTALFMAAQQHFPGSVPSDTDDDDDTDYHAAAAYESDD